MRHETIGLAGLRIMRGRYGNSRLEVRAPLRRLDRAYIACAGGTETFGPELAQPFPALLEQELNLPCVNLGTLNAGPGALFGDSTLLALCNGADRVVLQLTGAQGLGNRFYTVHPRRNDRFLRASAKLRALYPEIDFTDFCFVRHMLETLHRKDPGRFDAVRDELRAAWSMRMRGLFDRIEVPVTLVALPRRLGHGRLGHDPLFVTPAMIEALRPLAQGIVVVPGDEGTEAAQHRRVALDLARSLTAEAG